MKKGFIGNENPVNTYNETNFVTLEPFESIAASGIIKFLLKELVNKGW